VQVDQGLERDLTLQIQKPYGRSHDLIRTRHSFASFLVNAGRSLYEVQKILGHTQVKTTQRYAHLAQQTLVDAANAAVSALGSAFAPIKVLAAVGMPPDLMTPRATNAVGIALLAA
jgi:hypothetical protein